MKHTALILLSVFLGLGFTLPTPLHIGEVAEYEFKLKDKHVILNFMIGLDELEVFKNDQSCDYNELLAFCTSNYVLDNSRLFIDDNFVELQLESTFIKNRHLYISYQSITEIEQINTVSIYNNCFYSHYPQFKNRIIIGFDNFQASYLMNTKKNNLNCTPK